MNLKLYNKYSRLMKEQLKRKNIQTDYLMQLGMDNMLYAYFECLCLQLKGMDNNILFENLEYLAGCFFEYLEEFKENTNCFEVLKVLINYSARMEGEYRSKKMSALQDEIFEDYLKNLANDYYFIIPPEHIDREADKYRKQPKYVEQEAVKRKRRLSWLLKKKTEYESRA